MIARVIARVIPLLLLAAAASAERPAADPDAPVLVEDFEGGTGGAAVARLRDPRLAIVAGAGVGGGRALRATYVGGPMGSERLVHLLPLARPGTEYTLSYDVRFDAGFPFVRGGKLHGLGPRHVIAGGEPLRPDGWSARVMWRENGRAETYTYHQDQADDYGEAGVPVRAFAFRPGVWHAVSLHVRLNDPGAANGLVRLHVDGALIEARENLRLRTVGTRDSLISRFLFSTFHGGNDPSWAPRTVDGSFARVHAWFDNLAVWPGERIRARPGA